MIEKIKHAIFKEFGLNLVLEPFGENKARNNVFVGIHGKESFIVKIEELKQLQQVNISTQIASRLNSNSICSSRYLKTKNNEMYCIIDDKVITVQVKEELKKISTDSKKELLRLGERVADFHSSLSSIGLEKLKKSDFYDDFMRGDVPLAQSEDRLKEIEKFYEKYTPGYKALTNGVIHNDLNTNNIFQIGSKYFFIDFESVSEGPLISDLGVLSLELWNKDKGLQDYLQKLSSLVKGYEQKIKLSKYDKDNIIAFSLRYLYSDENWYNYWSLNGNPSAKELIPEIKEKQKILQSIILVKS